MRIALLQIGCRSCSSGDNVDNAARWVEEAYRTYNPDLIVLPEFFNTCYFPQYNDIQRYWNLAEPLDGRAVTALREQARDLSTCIAAGIYERGSTGIHFDTAVFVESDGSLAGAYRKIHAPAVPGGYEKLYYVPGTQYSVFDTSTGWKVGLLICYDWRFPEAARSLAIGGADLILMPFATPPMRLWSEALRTRAWENQLYVATCNRVGQDGNWVFAGASLVADPWGDVVAEGGANEEIVVADLDIEQISRARGTDFNWRDRRPDTYHALVRAADALPARSEQDG